MKKAFAGLLFFFINTNMLLAQQKWINVDSAFQPLPDNFHVYKSTDSLDGKPFIAYYAAAKLKDKHLSFTSDTSHNRRLTPQQFYAKNKHPLLVVNCTFFSYETNLSLNVVIKDGKMLAFNTHTIPMRGKDTFQYKHPLASAIGIDKKRNADVAWLYTDSLKSVAYARQLSVPPYKDSSLSFPSYFDSKNVIWVLNEAAARYGDKFNTLLQKWKMKTAVGGGPVLIQNGEIKITNNEELKFTGKAIDDKHPRTCMGYTNNGWLIVMVIQGRFTGIAEGATLTQEAQLLKDLGCVEALNLDGGGSSCMLINGKETITPSDKAGERPVPAVFVIKAPRKIK
jgi:exopolysaccharide biosynthesis protein